MQTKSFSRVAGAVARTVIKSKRLQKTYPPLSGKKRNKFSKLLFISEIVNASAKKSKLNPEVFLAAEALSDYIVRVDDLVDLKNHKNILSNKKAYKTDAEAFRRISLFVKQVKRLSLTKDEKNAIFKTVGNYRRDSFKVLGEYLSKNNPTFKELLRMKSVTTGGMARVITEVLCIAGKVPSSEKGKIIKAITNVSMAGQIADDLFDLHADYKEKTPNIVFGLLKGHPDELLQAMQMQKVTFLKMRRVCPKTSAKLMQLFNHYLSIVPDTQISKSVISLLPRWALLTASATKSSAHTHNE